MLQFFETDEEEALEVGLYGLMEQIVALRIALKPFALVGSEVPPNWPEDVAGICRFPSLDLKRAFLVYKGTSGDSTEWQTAR